MWAIPVFDPAYKPGIWQLRARYGGLAIKSETMAPHARSAFERRHKRLR